MTTLRGFDEEIVRDLGGIKEVTDDETVEEVRVAGDIRGDISTTIASLAELLKPKPKTEARGEAF